MRARLWLGLSTSLLASACGSGGGDAADSKPEHDAGPTCLPAPTEPPKGSLRLEQVWGLATHNAYWVNHGVPDAFASGTQERFVDQIAVHGVRSLEIDIHHTGAGPHAFAVYHTSPGNSLCDDLGQCLAELRAVDAALPGRDPVTIVLELKEIAGPNFDAKHTIEDLDTILEAAFGDRLYRPQDLFARCAAASYCPKTLSDCAAAVGFPEVEELRDKTLVGVMGNWDAIGAQAPADWVDYATKGDVKQRAAFPMASSWQVDWNGLPGNVEELVTKEQLAEAFSQSALMQVEDTTDPLLSPFLKRRGYVRIDGANSTKDQKTRIDLGAQLMQTDTPWIRLDGSDPASPFIPLENGTLAEEPGRRFALDFVAPGARVFASMRPENALSTRWEALVAAGESDEPAGCLRAAHALGEASETSFEVCREKVAADRSATAKGSPDAEQAFVHVRVCQQGHCNITTASSKQKPSNVGDWIALTLKPSSDGVCAQAQSAAEATPKLALQWHDVGETICFTSPLPFQGIAREDSSDKPPARVWFFATTLGGSSLSKSDFDSTVAEAAAGGSRSASSALVDASTD